MLKKLFTMIPLENPIQRHAREKLLSVVSFNILADPYAAPYQFPNIDLSILNFKNRSKLIIDSLKEFNSDIICLQECDHYSDFYKDALEDLGYSSIYFPRPEKLDGILVGAKKSRKLKPIKALTCDLNENHQYVDLPQFRRSNMACLIKFRDELNGNQILNVTNAHLYSNPQFDYVKYLQMYEVSRMICENINPDEATIFCGDTNSFPESNIIHTLWRKEPPSVERCPVVYQPEEYKMYEDIYKKYTALEPNLKWGSVYSNYKLLVEKKQEGEGHPEYTNFKSHFRKTLDYVFYLKNSKLKPISLLKIPTPEELQTITLPNTFFGSDHLPVMALFRYL